MQGASTVNGTERQTDWHGVNWRRANRVVRNLRQRIFRASKEGDLRRVASLQKLMLRSRSNVLVSVRRVTQLNDGKKTPGVDNKGGEDKYGNFELVHLFCHQQIHAKEHRHEGVTKRDCWS